jgi:hypothetical protein
MKVGAFCVSGHFSLLDNIASRYPFNKLFYLHTLCSGSRSRLDWLRTNNQSWAVETCMRKKRKGAGELVLFLHWMGNGRLQQVQYIQAAKKQSDA